MRIKKIELIGFKSFKDRTVIHFDAGITGIVGPNGCGKSNIVDALIWVMGEMSAKDLRGSTMTDVIFAGAEGYAPSGMAEVNLTLENDGGPFPVKYARHSEIMVTRRLHRSAESEYFINKEPARLKDIQEIFMDTGAGSKGFSIIAQGMIGKIITAKPEDRRMLIEEAAGITKFKARKRESQRKIQSTDQNLLRLQDIIGELKRQIDSLERQAQRAERYRTLKNRIEELDLWVSSLQFNDLRAAADECQKVFQELQALESQSEAEVSRLGGEVEALRLRLLEDEKVIDEMQAQQFEKQSQVQKLELEIQSLKFEIEQARRNEQMAGTLFQEQKARRDLLARDVSQLESQLETLRTEAHSLTEEFTFKNEKFSELQARITEADDELTTNRRELFALGQTLSAIEGRMGELKNQLQSLNDRQDIEKNILAELQERRVEFADRWRKLQADHDRERQMQLDLASDVESYEANRKILQNQLNEKRAEVEEFKDKLNEVTSRLYGLENLQQSFEGFAEGVKNVMLWQKAKQQEIHADGSISFRPVSEVVEVPAEYEVAMEAALGTRLQLLLSSSTDGALQAVDHLKNQHSGRSSFFLGGEDVARPNLTETPVGEGVKALLCDVVHCSEGDRTSVSFLLDGVAIVDSLRTALNLRPHYPGWTFVTQDGDTLGADGVLTGGSVEGADSGVLRRRREIKELTEQKNEWAGKLALAQAALKKIEEQIQTVTSDFEGAQKRKLDQEIRVTELRKDVERAETEHENAGMACQRQERTLAALTEQASELEKKISEIEANVLETRGKKEQTEAKVQELEHELQVARLGFDQRQAEVTDLQIRAARKNEELQGSERQLEVLRRQVGELDAQLGRMSEESEKNSTVATESQILLEERKIGFERGVSELETLRAEMACRRDEYERQAAELRRLEEKSAAAFKARNERQVRMNEAQMKFEQAKMKEQYLIDQVREKFMLNLPDIYQEKMQREGDPSTAEAELKDLREKIGRIGEVNLSAIEEYEETKQRYEFLTKQQADLTESKAQLHRVIDRINRICSKRFKETFDLVNERFTKVFPVLFGGGEARLEMTQDPDKDEQGIEIIARPPGKKMQNISLLSGGEKALTAVSLVFAIFLVKPSPYCLLDEVDAPLDDANVYRFNDLVREMAKRSQIILVTHNKHTMEVAGKLYGVTMQERGVSTMVSVDLASLRSS